MTAERAGITHTPDAVQAQIEALTSRVLASLKRYMDLETGTRRVIREAEERFASLPASRAGVTAEPE